MDLLDGRSLRKKPRRVRSGWRELSGHAEDTNQETYMLEGRSASHSVGLTRHPGEGGNIDKSARSPIGKQAQLTPFNIDTRSTHVLALYDVRLEEGAWFPLTSQLRDGGGSASGGHLARVEGEDGYSLHAYSCAPCVIGHAGWLAFSSMKGGKLGVECQSRGEGEPQHLSSVCFLPI